MPRIEKAKVSVDIAPPQEGWKSFQFNIHKFAALGTTKGHYFFTPEFSWSGHRWLLKIYPGGCKTATEGNVSVFLHHLSKESMAATFRITILDEFGNTKVTRSDMREFVCNNRGWPNFIKHSDILDESQNILDGSDILPIIIEMKDESTVKPFVPKNPFNSIIKGMFNDEETADVCFEVDSAEANNGGRRTKRSKTCVPFHAHRSILKKCAPMLANLCVSNDRGEVTSVPVSDVQPHVFRHLLYYVYGGSIAEEDLKHHAKDIIDAADKYSIVNLKLEAEAVYVESTAITIDNALDNLLYSDAKNCALLKETVMDFIAENGEEVIASVSFNDVPGHLMKDLLVATTRRSRKIHENNVTNDLNTMRVSELRRKLHENGLDVDGSREAMIEALKSDSSQG